MYKIIFFYNIYKNLIQQTHLKNKKSLIRYKVLQNEFVDIGLNVNDIEEITLIVATDTNENGALIKKQIETLVNENEELYFILYNTYNDSLGNSTQTINKINHARLNTEKPQKLIIEKKYKNALNITGFFINNITDNLVLNLNHLKHLENTKNVLYIDCDGILKRKQKHLNYILTSKNIVKKKINLSLIFSIITLWNQSKIFLNDINSILCTNTIINYILKPTNSLDFINLLKLGIIIKYNNNLRQLKKNKNVF